MPVTTPITLVCDSCDEEFIGTAEEYLAQTLDAESICENCAQNQAERAHERLVEDFHDGGSRRFISLEQQMAEARKLK